MRGIVLGLGIIALLLGGCRGWVPHGLPQPAAAPTAYHLQVDQLVFHSDFELPREHRLVRELTAERDEICRTLSLPCSDEAIDVYLFRDADAYGEFLARHFPNVPSRRAFFLETDTRLAVYAHWSDRVAEDLRHEVAHGYLHSVVPGLPLWLDEGLAEFFEVPRGQNGLNRPHVDLLSDMTRHEGWRPDLARLEKLTEAGQLQQLDYAEAWAWVYFLLHSDPERRELLTSYLGELRTQGTTKALSQWLAGHGAEPERLLGDYLAGLSQDTTKR